MSDIVYRPYHDGDEAALRELFHAVYGPDAERHTSAWRYLAPAPYPAVIQVAEADGRIVGAQPSHAIDLLIDGAPMKGLLLLDVMTHPDYRRRGVLTGVVEGLRQRAAREGYRLLLTTPNRDAERGFARLPAWRRMGELEPWIFPGDPASLVSRSATVRALLAPLAGLRRALRLRPGLEIPMREPGDAPLDSLWTATARLEPNQLVRDPRFLRWRFGPGSGRSYSLLYRESAAGQGVLAVTCPGQLLHRDVVLLAEFMVAPGCTHEATEALRSIGNSALDCRMAAVVGWFSPGAAACRSLRSAGFICVPAMARPRPYSVWAATDLPGRSAPRALDLASWHMTLADSDLG